MKAEGSTAEARVVCRLVGLDGKTRQFDVPVNGPILIGRGPYNHITIDDVRVSRQHARVGRELEGYVVCDLNSVNGTYVNDVAVNRAILQPNDVIRCGPYSFRVEFRDAPERRTETSHDSDLPTGRYVASSVSMMASMASALESAHDLPASSRSGAIVDLVQLEAEHSNLRTLYAFVQSISKTIDKRELLPLITDKIREIYPIASIVAIYLRGASKGWADELRLAHSFVSDSSTEPPSLPEEVTRSFFEARGPVLMTNSRFVRSGGTTMYAPMIDRGETIGVIQVTADGRSGRGGFSRGDLDLLNGMATPAAIMLQNTRMYEASLARDRLNHDLELAAQIQKSFLPREVISVEGLDLYAVYRAAYTVGGDFYDVFWVAPNRLALFIGDISGKGVSAALLMARISSELRVAAMAQVEPVAVLSMMNNATLMHARSEFFFTAIYLTLDVKTGEVVLANAGHCTPYWCHADGRVEAVTAGAAGAVGILDNGDFKATSFRLGHGDSLVLYTDGVVEASNADGDLYGTTRLENCLAESSNRAADIADHILRSVEDHGLDGPGNDDLTLFICQRNIGRPPSMQPRRKSGSLKLSDLNIEFPR